MLKAIEARLTPNESWRKLADPVFRILTSLIFIVGGLGHFFQHQVMLDRMEDSPWSNLIIAIGNPSLLLWLSGAVFVLFGISLALGFMTRLSALLILVTLIPITFTIHIAPGHTGPLFKNIAIMGALLLLMARGPGAYAIDKGD